MPKHESAALTEPTPAPDSSAMFTAPVQLPPVQRKLVTLGVITGLFLGALEGTVVGTAMPTVVARLGGIDIYSWVFSIYLLTSTVTMPVWGKLSDLYGRRRFYLIGIGLFMLGSALSGQASSMVELITCRAIQGLGAGALVPLGLTIIGDIYSLAERSRMQGLFSGVWGVASLIGPLVGGLITEHISWRWVFYINVPFGLAAATIIGLTLKEPPIGKQARLDIKGVISFAASMTLLLLAMMKGGRGESWNSPAILSMFLASAVALVLFIVWERAAQEPIIPLTLLQENRLFFAGSLNGFLAGMAMFGTMSFIPLYVQGVLGTSATKAGVVLIPLTFGWTTFSIISSRLLLRVGYRPLVITGMISLVAGFLLLVRLNPTTPWALICADVFLIGVGMGLSVVTMTIAVQNSVPRHYMGIATSAITFFRIIGGMIAVAIMGTVMIHRLRAYQATLSSVPTIHSGDIARLLEHPDALIDPLARAHLSQPVLTAVQSALADALGGVFWVGLIVSLLAFLSAFLVPKGKAHELAIKREAVAPAGE
ncbi:MAG: MFS transporter [Blastocatellia bacterium]|nr:MFS transporter [Blastocatellia bacterium]